MIVIGARAPYMHRLYERWARRWTARSTCSPAAPGRRRGNGSCPSPTAYRFAVVPGLRWYRSAVSNLYINPAIVPRLAALRPSLVVVNDFAPTMLMAAAAARWLGVPYGLRTDGVPETDPGWRSRPHRAMRRLLVPGARFGLGASAGSLALLAGYGLPAGPPRPGAALSRLGARPARRRRRRRSGPSTSCSAASSTRR